MDRGALGVADTERAQQQGPRAFRWRRAFHAFRLPPPWLGNLLVFGFLVLLTLIAFFLQTRAAERRFVADSAEHTRLLADAVRLYARGAVLAGETTDTILTALLGNSARFVVYLDDIEPFSAEELTGFAAESGLAMIRILRAETPHLAAQSDQPAPGDASEPRTREQVQGPPDRYRHLSLPCQPLEQLRPLPEDGGLLFSVPRFQRPGCAMVALESPAVDALRDAISVEQALATIRQLPRVRSVRLDGQPSPVPLQDHGNAQPPQIRIIQADDGATLAEARAPIAGAELVLRLDGSALGQRRRALWLAFGAFLVALLGAGALGTWLLFKVQAAHERQLRTYERRLSVQREEASLGRAASTIAHEIRNPLNAIGLGLQRLQLEARALPPAQRDLIDQVMQAVRSTNGTVSHLLAYARTGQRERVPIDLVALVQDALALHRKLLEHQAARIELELPPAAWVIGDAEQLRRALDNLLANAREALPVGGRLAIALTRHGNDWRIDLVNDGLDLSDEPLERLIEPWFTTKANGTGLGLAIVRRILDAHQGRLALDEPLHGRFRARMWLPASSLDNSADG